MRTWVAAALALGACGTSAAPAAPSPPPVAAPVVPVVEAGWIEPAPPGAPLVVGVDGISLDGAPILALSDRRIADGDLLGGAHAFLAPRVRDAVAAHPGSALALAIDPSIPYETVVRVVYSAIQSQRAIAFVIQRGAERGVVPIALPPAVPRRGDVAAPGVELTITSGGITVSGSDGRLAPGCVQLQEGPAAPTVERTASGHDLTALALCLEHVHAAFSADDTVTIDADPDTAFADVARVMVAARGTAAAPLFPRTQLAVHLD